MTTRSLCREHRGFPNLDSARRNGGFAQTQLNPLPLRLLETWSPCSRPFAILPVSAVSDAQKLATGNFLHVRACFLVTFCTTQKVTSRSPSQEASRFSKPRFSSPKQRFRTNKIKTFHQGSFEVFQTSNQRTQTQTSHTPLKSFAAPQLLRRLAATSFFYFLCYKK